MFEIQFIHCQERKRPEGLDDIGGLIAEGVRKKDFSHIDIEAAANIQNIRCFNGKRDNSAA